MNVDLQAKAIFAQHYNCSQSVLSVFAEQYGLDLSTALKLATPFGGGMGHTGQVCGAVSGALMVIGLAAGISEIDREQKYRCYDLAREFHMRFRALHGDVTCPGLLGMDIRNPDELARVRELKLFDTLCCHFVADAARLVEELLAERV